MKIAIFHDYFRMVGGAEKLVISLAKNLKADIITGEADAEVVRKAGGQGLRVIVLGDKTLFPHLLPNVCRQRFEKCDYSCKYDFFIFSGNYSVYASIKHSPNMWYCHTPPKGIYPNVFNSRKEGQ